MFMCIYPYILALKFKTSVPQRTLSRLPAYIHTYIHTYIYTHIYIYIYIYICRFTYMYIYTHIYVYIYICIDCQVHVICGRCVGSRLGLFISFSSPKCLTKVRPLCTRDVAFARSLKTLFQKGLIFQSN